jgi:hypothetical protein
MALTKPSLFSRRRALALTASLAAGAAACSDDDPSSTGSTGSSTGSGADDLSDVVYEGGATDEALVALVAQSPKEDAAQAAGLVAPASGETISATTPFAFSWAVGSASFREPGALERAIGLLFGVREAHAHGTPISGRAYFLVFSTQSDTKLLRVFTTALTYTPSADAWAKLTAAGAPITVTIVNAIFESNRVADGGGPYAGTSKSFQIG